MNNWLIVIVFGISIKTLLPLDIAANNLTTLQFRANLTSDFNLLAIISKQRISFCFNTSLSAQEFKNCWNYIVNCEVFNKLTYTDVEKYPSHETILSVNYNDMRKINCGHIILFIGVYTLCNLHEVFVNKKIKKGKKIQFRTNEMF